MTTKQKENLSGTINELLLILKEIDFYIGENKQLNGQLDNLKKEKGKLQDIIIEITGQQ